MTGGEMTDELDSLSVRWCNPALPSVVDAGDSMVKLVSAFPWLADTTVALEEVGFTDEQIVRIMSDKRRTQSKETLQTLLDTGKVAGDGGQERPQPAGDGTKQRGESGSDQYEGTLGADTGQVSTDAA